MPLKSNTVKIYELMEVRFCVYDVIDMFGKIVF